MQQMTCYEKRTRDSWCRDSELDTHDTCDALVHKRCVHCCWWLTWSQHLLQYMQPHIQNCWARKAGLHSAMTKRPSFPPHMYEVTVLWTIFEVLRQDYRRAASVNAYRFSSKSPNHQNASQFLRNTPHYEYISLFLHKNARFRSICRNLPNFKGTEHQTFYAGWRAKMHSRLLTQDCEQSAAAPQKASPKRKTKSANTLYDYYRFPRTFEF